MSNPPIKVISLKRTKLRRKFFKESNKHLKFTFFDAIDGDKLVNDDFINTNYFIQPLSFLTTGTYGVALSHLKLWEYAITNNTPLTILEDDVVCRYDFDCQVKRVLEQIPNDYDIVFWGSNLDSLIVLDIMSNISPGFVRFSQRSIVNNLQAFQNDTTIPYPLKIKWNLGIPAYTISVEGAQKFKSQCWPLRNFTFQFPYLIPLSENGEETEICCQKNEGLDISMAIWYQECKVYQTFPILAIPINDAYNSTVHHVNKKNKRVNIIIEKGKN